MADVTDDPTTDSQDAAAAERGAAGSPKATAKSGQQSTTGLAVAYFMARFGIFVAILAVFWLVGFRGLPGALAAAILSIPVSFFALGRMRERVAGRMEQRKSEQLDLKSEFRSAGKSARD